MHKKDDSRATCGTQRVSLPLLPPGPGGVRDPSLRRPGYQTEIIYGGEGEIRTHGTCVHTRSRRAP